VIRVLAFLVRRPDLSRDAFRAHYEEVHVPTALPLLEGVRRYVRHHVREELHGRPGFDCMTALEYPDLAAMQRLQARLAGPEGEAVRSDELRFMDKPRNAFFPVEPACGSEVEDSAPAPAETLVCVSRPAGVAPEAFRARFAEESLPALRAALALPSACRPLWASAGPTRGAGYDAVVELGAAGADAIAAWAAELEGSRARVVAVRVSAHATAMPPSGGGS